MPETGWTGEAPEPERPDVGGYTGFLAGLRADPDEGRTMAEVIDRSRLHRDQPEDRRDQDEEMANLMAAGYQPGSATMLASRLADAQAELQGVREKNEAARQRQARIARDHNAGRTTAFDIARMDFDEPDPATEQRLERRVQNLRGKLAEMTDRIAPAAQRAPDPVEEAGRRAHQAFIESTRARLENRPAPRPRAARPFGDGVSCSDCAAAGATAEESRALHADGGPLAVR
jgi:hypothetical protein